MAVADETLKFGWCYLADEAIFMSVSSELTWICVLGCAAMAYCATAMAASEVVPDEANPYSVISDRNIFHLNPPPPPVSADAPKPLDLPKVMLTGFVGKGTSMKVLLAIPPAKDSKDTIAYLSLAPGDREHDVQLVKIHLDKEEVEIINSGTAQTLSAKSNSYAALAASPHSEGGPHEKGVPGIHRPMIPGFTPPGRGVQGEPAAETANSNFGRRSGGSSIIAGSGDNYASAFGGSSSGAIVSGGSSYGASGGVASGQYVPSGTAAAGGDVGARIANTLFNPQTPNYQTPISAAPIIPPENQGPIMALKKATSEAATGGGFPPLPPIVQEEMDAATGQAPPPMPNQ
jgi:hypothetical protein